MQIQTAIRPKASTARSIKLGAEPRVAGSLSTISWATFAHRRRLAKMNRELMKFLSQSAQVCE